MTARKAKATTRVVVELVGWAREAGGVAGLSTALRFGRDDNVGVVRSGITIFSGLGEDKGLGLKTAPCFIIGPLRQGQ
jgi:hypothetical protein